MRRMKEKMDPKDFFDFPKQVRDAAEKIYNLFERDTLNNILKKKEAPSMWRNITSTLSPKEAEQATELAFAWSAEDSMSSSRFPEAKEENMKTITIQEEFKIPGTNVVLEEGDKVRVIKERVAGSVLNLFQMLDEAEKILSTDVLVSLIKSTLKDYSSERIIQEFAQDLNDNIGDELQYQ